MLVRGLLIQNGLLGGLWSHEVEGEKSLPQQMLADIAMQILL